jgi:hypothetical protein
LLSRALLDGGCGRTGLRNSARLDWVNNVSSKISPFSHRLS